MTATVNDSPDAQVAIEADNFVTAVNKTREKSVSLNAEKQAAYKDAFIQSYNKAFDRDSQQLDKEKFKTEIWSILKTLTREKQDTPYSNNAITVATHRAYCASLSSKPPQYVMDALKDNPYVIQPNITNTDDAILKLIQDTTLSFVVYQSLKVIGSWEVTYATDTNTLDTNSKTLYTYTNSKTYYTGILPKDEPPKQVPSEDTIQKHLTTTESFESLQQLQDSYLIGRSTTPIPIWDIPNKVVKASCVAATTIHPTTTGSADPEKKQDDQQATKENPFDALIKRNNRRNYRPLVF